MVELRTRFPRVAEARVDPTATPGDRDVEQFLVEEAVLEAYHERREREEALVERRQDARAEARALLEQARSGAVPVTTR